MVDLGSRIDGGSTSRMRSSENRAARKAMAICSGCPFTGGFTCPVAVHSDSRAPP